MIHWLYRYIFRGIGILFVIGMITAFFLSIGSQLRQSEKSPVNPTSDTRTTGGRVTK